MTNVVHDLESLGEEGYPFVCVGEILEGPRYLAFIVLTPTHPPVNEFRHSLYLQDTSLEIIFRFITLYSHLSAKVTTTTLSPVHFVRFW